MAKWVFAFLVLLALVLQVGRCMPVAQRGESPAGGCKTQMASFGLAIQDFWLATGRFPRSLAELTRTTTERRFPFIRSIPADPWGSAYEYRVMGPDTYSIRSFGEDRQRSTDDDLVFPDPEDG